MGELPIAIGAGVRPPDAVVNAEEPPPLPLRPPLTPNRSHDFLAALSDDTLPWNQRRGCWGWSPLVHPTPVSRVTLTSSITRTGRGSCGRPGAQPGTGCRFTRQRCAVAMVMALRRVGAVGGWRWRSGACDSKRPNTKCQAKNLGT